MIILGIIFGTITAIFFGAMAFSMFIWAPWKIYKRFKALRAFEREVAQRERDKKVGLV